MGKKEKTAAEESDQLQDQNLAAEEPQATDTENQTESPENKGVEVEELEDLQQEISELKDKNLRMRAEFDNFKRRTMREKIELMNTAAQDTLAAILPVLDDFDRAKKNADDEKTTEQFSEGVTLVYNKLWGALRQRGLRKMESTGETFDPELHEAVTEIPAPSEELKGKVIDTIETGFFLKEKIIRHAKVVVGK
ncbi:MAG: nucleotide exchange factor GrpE [Bacteroidota bacterium]